MAQMLAFCASLDPEKEGPGFGVDRNRGVFLLVVLGRTYFR